MKNYYVEFEQNGEVEEATVQADNPGHAFAKVLKSNPGYKLRRCIIEGHLCGKSNLPKVSLEYDAPSTAKPETSPSETREQTLMPFMQ